MRTLDVTKMGIDRNFLRQCERHDLIKPHKAHSEWIIHEEYTPKEYSQKDIEIVWNAYLCRKMGLSYAEISKLTQGEEISVRDSLNDLIPKYESQIEELKALTEFMRYVKGFGYLPSMPDTPMGSKSFKDYLIDFMEYLDKDKKIKKVFTVAEFVSQVDDIETIEIDKLNKIEELMNDIAPNTIEEFRNNYTLAFLDIKNKVHLETTSEETQTAIHKIFYYQKKLINDDNLSAWDFATNFIGLLYYNSDISAMYKKILGKKAFDYLQEALLEFLLIEEPNKIKEIGN